MKEMTGSGDDDVMMVETFTLAQRTDDVGDDRYDVRDEPIEKDEGKDVRLPTFENW